MQQMGSPVVNPHPLDTGLYGRQRFSLVTTVPFEIRALGTEHIPVFRALRLEALRQHPEAFVPTWEEERAVDPSTAAARFRNDWVSEGNFILGAFVHGRLVGAIGVRRWTRQKQNHRATIWLFFTDPVVRGQGIGRSLLNAAIEECRRHPELELLHLSVSVESDSAYRLYAQAGFRCYGVEPRAIRLEDRSIDVALMVLELRESFEA
jgi:RimJ/RimL family protein N-acetyltransferase